MSGWFFFVETIMLYCVTLCRPYDVSQHKETAGLSQHYSETVKACEMQNFFKKGEGLKLCTWLTVCMFVCVYVKVHKP